MKTFLKKQGKDIGNLQLAGGMIKHLNKFHNEKIKKFEQIKKEKQQYKQESQKQESSRTPSRGKAIISTLNDIRQSENRIGGGIDKSSKTKP